jgi:putative Holliday junction resolvase
MNGTIGERAKVSEQFAEELKNRFPGISVVLWDERLSTVAAERVLIDADLQRKKRRKVIDMMAAVVILQNYLDSRSLRRS